MYFTFILVDLYFTQCVMQYVHKTNYTTTRKKYTFKSSSSELTKLVKTYMHKYIVNPTIYQIINLWNTPKCLAVIHMRGQLNRLEFLWKG